MFPRSRTPHTTRHSVLLATAVMGITALAHTAPAATDTWNGLGADANWTTPANWVDVLAPVPGNALAFGGSTQTSTNNDFAANTAFDSLNFNADAAGFSLNGNAVTLSNGITVNSTASSHTVGFDVVMTASQTVNVAGGTLTLNGPISSSVTADFIKTGAGRVILGATNTWTGKTQLNGGFTRGNDGTQIPSAGNLSLGGGILETSAAVNRALGTGAGEIQITSGNSGFSAVGGAVAVTLGAASSTLTWGSATFNPGTLTLNATGANSTLTFNNGFDLAGGNRIINVAAQTAIITGAIANSIPGGTLTKAGGTSSTLVLTASQTTMANHLNVAQGVLQINLTTPQNFTLTGNLTGGANATVLFPQNINNPNTTITLSGDNSAYAGRVLWQAGTVMLTSDTTFGNGVGLLEIRNNQANNSLTTLVVSGNRTINNPVTYFGAGANNPGLVFNGAGNVTFNGAITGAATNQHWNNNLANGGTITFNNAFYSSNSASSRNTRLNGTGTYVFNGAIYNAQSAANQTASGSNSALYKNDTGTTILNSTALEYTGGTQVTGGTLIFNVNGVLPATALNGTATSNAYIRVDQGGAVGYAGGIADPAFLSRMSGANTSDPAVTSAAFGSLAVISAADAATSLNFNTAPTTGPNWSSMGLGAAQGAFTYTGTLTPKQNASLQNLWRLGGGNGTLTFGQAMDNGGASGGSLTVLGGGNGVLVLTSNASSYTGSTTITAFQTLRNGVDNAVSTASSNLVVGSTVSNNTAVYDLNGFHQSVNTLTGFGTIKSTIGTPILSVNADGTSSVFNGAITGTVGVTQNGTGSLTIAGPSLYTGVTTVNSGVVRYTGFLTHNVGALRGAAVEVDANTTVSIATSAGTSKLNALSIAGSTGAWTGRVDIKNNALILQAADTASKATTFSTLVNQVISGKAGGTWSGPGLASTAIVANVNATMAIVDNGALGLSTYGGQNVDANSLIVTRAILGDADLSGNVDLGDFDKWFANVSNNTFNYAAGDFDLSGIVDLGDFDIWFSHVGVNTLGLGSAAGISITGGAAAVPEPASLAVLALGGGALLARRRRK